MNLKTLLAVAGLSVAAFAIPAVAQDAKTINGTPVPEAEVDLVQQHCEALLASESSTTDDSATDDATSVADANNDNSTDSSTSGDAADLGAAVANLSIDLTTVNLAICREGGWVE
jgi:hypothetical protein